MENNIIEVSLENKSCENCGGEQLESLWSYKYIAKSSTKKWKFSVNNCICVKCGYVFVSPSYSEASLSEYYSDARIYFQIDYSIDKRLSVVCRYAGDRQGTYLELGAKQNTEFHDLLKPHFAEVSTQGIEQASDCDLNKLEVIASESVDLLTHYFVLEHVPNVKAFLSNCWEALKPGGVMIVEVPDLNKYPHDIAALMLYEHTNHFSIHSLEQLCLQVGFELIEKDHENASRSFGMVAVFKKAQPQREIVLSKETYLSNKQYFVAGVSRANEYSKC
jgi:predicted SAM-dependent methyltransferase